jgi:hypothetical protein
LRTNVKERNELDCKIPRALPCFPPPWVKEARLPFFGIETDQFMISPGKIPANGEQGCLKNTLRSTAYEWLTLHNMCISQNSVEIFRTNMRRFLFRRVEVKSGMAEAYPTSFCFQGWS